MPSLSPELLTQAEAAARLGRSVSTVERLRRVGALRWLPGRPVRVYAEDVAACMARPGRHAGARADAARRAAKRAARQALREHPTMIEARARAAALLVVARQAVEREMAAKEAAARGRGAVR
jgi:hypothetical protein